MSSRHKKFVDEATIFVQAGHGGDGCASFRREKFVPRGGPSGGDGGRGGDIVLVGAEQLGTLLDFKFRRHFRAEHGKPGGRSARSGADGDSQEISVPLGTLVYEKDSGECLGEILEPNQRFVLEKGGAGGLGNIHFKSSTCQAPRQATPGDKREGRWVRLELRLLADIGLVGPPNVGKSTLLAALSAARPKIADYPFTTLQPVLGVLKREEKSIVLADIPGLITGAHNGSGLGIQFLRHIARTSGLLFVTSAESCDPPTAFAQYETTREELSLYEPQLLNRPSQVVLNKIDLCSIEQCDEFLHFFRARNINVIPVSARDKVNLTLLGETLDGLL